MIPVNNRPIIVSLAKSQFKGNRLRNLLLILAIFLATFMLTSVFSLGINYYQAVNERNIRLDGALYDGTVWGADKQQIDAFKNQPNVKHAGLMVGCATMTEFEGMAIETSLVWSDATNWQSQISPALEYVEGHYPQKQEELLLSRKALQKMGIEAPKIGMTLPVTYATDNGLQQQTFTLSGYFNDYSNKNRGFISEDFFKSTHVSISDLNKARLYLTFNNPFLTDADVEALSAEIGLEPPQLLRTDTELVHTLRNMIMVVCGLILLVAISAYLLIYNILSLSINKDIRYYGLLKTIGTTRKQIKEVVFRQMLRLSLIGIPLGLVAGALLTYTLIPSLLKAVSIYALTTPAKINPFIFSGAALFSFLTVFLSTQQPARLASEISPIEAIHYTDVSQKKQRQPGRYRTSILSMAWRNMFRQKKRALIVFLSLTMGLTAFLTITTLLDSKRADRVLNQLVTFDLILHNKTAGEKNSSQLFDVPLLTEINQLEGIKTSHILTATDAVIPLQQDVFGDFITTMYRSYMNETYEDGLKRMEAHPEDFTGVVIGVNEALFDRLVAENKLTLSKAAFLAGETCILSSPPQFVDSLKNRVGHDFELLIEQQPYTLKIGGLSDSINTPSAGYSGFYPEIIVSDQLIGTLVEKPLISSVLILYQQSYDRPLEKQLTRLVADQPKIDRESKIERYDNMRDSEKQLAVFGYALAVILAALGIMNYVNLMTTGIITRTHEFATLQSIGMSRKQLHKLLLAEGLGYGLLSLCLVLSFGTAIAYGLFQLNNIDKLAFIMPVRPLTIAFSLVLIICTLIPLLIFKLTQTGSIIEQLKHH